MDRGAWWAIVHGVAKSWTRLSDFPYTFHFHALEKEMAIHSSVLAWRIPGRGKPGGLPSMGSQSRTQLKQLSSSSSNTLKGNNNLNGQEERNEKGRMPMIQPYVCVSHSLIYNSLQPHGLLCP